MKNHCPDNVIDDNSVLIHNDLSLDQFEVNGNPILTQNDTSGSANSFFDSESSQDSSSGDMDGSFSDLSSNDISGDNGFDFTITKDSLSLCYTNADNLMNKIDELKARIHTISPDILVLVEVYPKTGSSMEITAVELNITGYQMYRSKVENRSRGVIIYVSDSLSSSLEVDLIPIPSLNLYGLLLDVITMTLCYLVAFTEAPSLLLKTITYCLTYLVKRKVNSIPIF